MKSLEIRYGDKTVRHRLPEGVFRIGRVETCEIVVEHPSVSRRHLEIRPNEERFEVLDLDSTNGLWVDGQRVAEAIVGPDQPFVLGSIIAVIRDVVSFDSGEHPQHDEPSTPRDGGAGHDARDRNGDDRTLDEPRTIEGPTPFVSDKDPFEGDAIVEALLREGRTTFGYRGAFVWAGRDRLGGVRYVAGIAPPEGAARVEDPAPDGREADDGPWGRRVLVRATSAHGARAVVGFLFDDDTAIPDGTAFALFGDLLAGLAADREPEHAPDRKVTVQDARVDDTPYVATTPFSRAPFDLARRLASDDMPVLLLGASGTGKELLARLLHDEGRRRDGPFVAINCSAIPADLLEAELFGIERGVATGVHGRSGRFLQASGGTLFLDEIGDLPSTLQPKLLRVLDTAEVVPVGSSDARPIQVRVVSATNVNLPVHVEQGRFRQDLFYRLAGVRIEIPALVERRDDILPLARRFAREASRKRGKSFLGFEPRFVRALLGHSWPGNVRELRHAIDGAVVLSEGATLEHRHLPAEIRSGADESIGEVLLSTRQDWRAAKATFARWYFRALLDAHDANMTDVAARAGLGRSSLYRILDELGLR